MSVAQGDFFRALTPLVHDFGELVRASNELVRTLNKIAKLLERQVRKETAAKRTVP